MGQISQVMPGLEVDKLTIVRLKDSRGIFASAPVRAVNDLLPEGSSGY